MVTPKTPLNHSLDYYFIHFISFFDTCSLLVPAIQPLYSVYPPFQVCSAGWNTELNSWLQQLSHCLGDDGEELFTSLFEWTEGGAAGRDGAPGWRFPATGNGRSEVGACRHQVGLENKEAWWGVEGEEGRRQEVPLRLGVQSDSLPGH